MSLRVVKAAGLLLAWYALAGAPLAVGQAAAGASPVPHSTAPVPPAPDDSLPPITVQIAPPPISISSSMIGVAGPLGAQAAVGKPLVARFVTEHHQNFTDGNSISSSTASVIYRDTAGRIRRESQLSVPGLPVSDAAATFITIVDHQSGYGWVLNPQEMVARRYELNGSGPAYVAHLSAQGGGSGFFPPDSKPGDAAAGTAAANASENSRWHLHSLSAHCLGPSQGFGAEPGAMSAATASSVPGMRIDQPFLAAPNPVRTENLGEQMILGYRVHGVRVITTLPSGEIGNDRPIDIVSEQWFSPELELVMRSMHRDPWGGEFTTTVTRISRGEQPAALFKVPAQYKVIDSDTEDANHVLDTHGSYTAGAEPH